jgi:hypothetical protein
MFGAARQDDARLQSPKTSTIKHPNATNSTPHLSGARFRFTDHTAAPSTLNTRNELRENIFRQAWNCRPGWRH